MGRIIKLSSILLLSSSLLIGCGSKDTGPLTGKEITLELKTDTEYYAVYKDGGSLKVHDYLTATDTDATGKLLKQCNPVLKLTKDVTDKQDVDIDDPTTFSDDIKLTTPYTYDSNLKASSMYVNYLKENGWTSDTYGSSSKCIDMLFEKGEENRRIIITQDELKVFKNINKNYSKNLTYILER